jgi:hypothetical protein
MTQTSVNLDPVKGVVGAIADNSTAGDNISQVANETILYGNFVALDQFRGKAIRPSAAADVTDINKRLGIALRDESVESKDDGLDANYSANQQMSIRRLGRVYVKPEELYTLDSDVFVRISNKPTIKQVAYSQDFIAGDNVSITINGATITTPFDTDNATTYANIDANLTAAFAGTLQDVTVDATARTIDITSVLNTDITVTATATVGGATATVVESQAGTSENTIGAIRCSADGGTAVQLTNAKFVTTGSAGTIGVLELGVL